MHIHGTHRRKINVSSSWASWRLSSFVRLPSIELSLSPHWASFLSLVIGCLPKLLEGELLHEQVHVLVDLEAVQVIGVTLQPHQ